MITMLKIVFSSSAATYGDKADIISEDMPANPKSPYGEIN